MILRKSLLTSLYALKQKNPSAFVFCNKLNSLKLQTSKMSHDSNKPDISKLSTLQYQVTQEKHTEAPFSGKFDKFMKLGTYECIVCGQELFKSEHKFDSGCGWPAFFDSINPARIREERDESYGRVRTEVLCAKCGAHLGHVFDDGPKPTRRRFCINSVSMKFKLPTGEEIEDPGHANEEA